MRPINKSPTSEYTLSVIERFNTPLEAKFLHTLKDKRLRCRHPNESVLPLREPWLSTSTLSRAYMRHSTADASDRTYNDVFEDQEEPSSKSSAFVDADSSEIASKGNLLTIPTPCAKRDTLTVQHRAEERRASMRPLRSIAASQGQGTKQKGAKDIQRTSQSRKRPGHTDTNRGDRACGLSTPAQSARVSVPGMPVWISVANREASYSALPGIQL